MPQFKYHVPTSYLVPLTASILFVVLSIRLNASQILGNSTPKRRQTLQYTQNAICHWPHPPSLSALPFLSGCLPAQPTVEQNETDTSLFTYAMWVVLLPLCVCVLERITMCIWVSVCVCVRECVCANWPMCRLMHVGDGGARRELEKFNVSFIYWGINDRMKTQ